MSDFRLPAKFQPQIWVNDNAQDAGASKLFDAHDSILQLGAKQFTFAALQIINGGHDYDEVALKAGVAEQWLAGSKDATFYVDIDIDDFLSWLESIGSSRDEAQRMTEERLDELRAATPAAPAP